MPLPSVAGINRNYTLVPLSRVAKQNYTTYFNISGGRVAI